MAPFYGCRDPGTKLDGVKLAPVTTKRGRRERAIPATANAPPTRAVWHA